MSLYEELGNFEVRAGDDPDPALVCIECDDAICDIEHTDGLDTLARVAMDHWKAHQTDPAVPHPPHDHCWDGCGLAVTHDGACLDKPGGRTVCEHPEEEIRADQIERDDIIRDLGNDDWTRVLFTSEVGDSVVVNNATTYDRDTVLMRLEAR